MKCIHLKIANVPSSSNILGAIKGNKLAEDSIQVLEVPIQPERIPDNVIQYAERRGIEIRESSQ